MDFDISSRSRVIHKICVDIWSSDSVSQFPTGRTWYKIPAKKEGKTSRKIKVWIWTQCLKIIIKYSETFLTNFQTLYRMSHQVLDRNIAKKYFKITKEEKFVKFCWRSSKAVQISFQFDEKFFSKFESCHFCDFH